MLWPVAALGWQHSSSAPHKGSCEWCGSLLLLMPQLPFALMMSPHTHWGTWNLLASSWTRLIWRVEALSSFPVWQFTSVWFCIIRRFCSSSPFILLTNRMRKTFFLIFSCWIKQTKPFILFQSQQQNLLTFLVLSYCWEIFFFLFLSNKGT